MYGSDYMVILFKNMPVLANDLRQDLNKAIANTCGLDGFTVDDKQYTVFSLRRQIYVQPNGALFVDDDLDEGISGYLLEALRSQGYLIEDAKIIVPAKKRENISYVPPFRMQVSPAEEDNIIRFEDLLPDSAFDDGRFEEEMREFAQHNPNDDE